MDLHEGEVAVTIPWTWSLGILEPLWKWREMTTGLAGRIPEFNASPQSKKVPPPKLMLPLAIRFCCHSCVLSAFFSYLVSFSCQPFIEVLFSQRSGPDQKRLYVNTFAGSNAWLKAGRIGMEGQFAISPKTMALWDFYHPTTIFTKAITVSVAFDRINARLCVCVRPPRGPTLSPSATLEHFFIRSRLHHVTLDISEYLDISELARGPCLGTKAALAALA